MGLQIQETTNAFQQILLEWAEVFSYVKQLNKAYRGTTVDCSVDSRPVSVWEGNKHFQILIKTTVERQRQKFSFVWANEKKGGMIAYCTWMLHSNATARFVAPGNDMLFWYPLV